MSETKEYYVYKHTNKTNGKVYIGITSLKPKARWQNGRGYSDNKYFTNAINKYGWDGFDHLVLVRGLTEDEAKWLEIQLIAVYDSTNRKKGYNISKGGDIVSDESRQKMSMSRKGKFLSENHKQKISEGLKGQKLSQETKQKISESRKGRFTSYDSPRSKTIICISTGTCFGSAREAAGYYGISRGDISRCCNGKRNYCGKLPDGTKLKWVYVQDLPKPQVSDEQKQLLRNGPKLLKVA